MRTVRSGSTNYPDWGPSLTDEIPEVGLGHHNHDKQNARTRALREKMALCLKLISGGCSVYEAIADRRIAVSYSAYRKWRERYPSWAAEVDIARKADDLKDSDFKDLTSARFALRYFGRERTHFQQRWINEVESCPPGDITLAMWPPEWGKTTTFEDFGTEKVARDAGWRSTVVGANGKRGTAIVSRIRKRLEPDGPCPKLVKEWGPFRPDAGRSKAVQTFHQPWNNTEFSVLNNRSADEREPNMYGAGWNTDILSIRTDHLHIDDLQSVKTLGMTEKMLEWFRQDALSRPGETGITTVNGSRTGDGDFLSALEDDDELTGIIHIVKIKAIVTNLITGELESAWPEKYSLESLERIRLKIKDEAFDRSYLMAPGVSKTKRTFSDEGKALALNGLRRLNHYEGLKPLGDEGSYMKPPIILTLDPAISPGLCVLNGWLMEPDKMRLVYAVESESVYRNEDIFTMIDVACNALDPHFRIVRLIVEAMNFQRGLARDERLQERKRKWGFTMGEHLTGINKYDEDVGLASMAGDWEAGMIELPYANDPATRTHVDEICRQLKAWKPKVKGNRLRRDRVMTMWFAWIWWRANRKRVVETKAQSWQRQGVPYGTTRPDLIIPIGARV